MKLNRSGRENGRREGWKGDGAELNSTNSEMRSNETKWVNDKFKFGKLAGLDMKRRGREAHVLQVFFFGKWVKESIALGNGGMM